MTYALRKVVTREEKWPELITDLNYIMHKSRNDFNQAIRDEFSKPDWKPSEAKILSWTNATAINYNKLVHQHLTGNDHFAVGDYVICNSFQEKLKLPVESLVRIASMIPIEMQGIPGYSITVTNNTTRFFLPHNRKMLQKRINHLYQTNPMEANHLKDYSIDLRLAYASTINKAQGSTYKKVFLDLDDVGKCIDSDNLARLMYVGSSRPSQQLIFTGSLN